MTVLRFIVLAVAACVAVYAQQRTLNDNLRLYNDYKLTYGRVYPTEEDSYRFKCFRANLDLIEQRNALGGERHGVNAFTDVCADEFKRTHNGYKRNLTFSADILASSNSAQSSAAGPPAAPISPSIPINQTVDWRKLGAVTPIKNQGSCGSCWAFSAVANMEGQWFLAGNTLVGLSEEEVTACSTNGGNSGCNGGDTRPAYEFIISNGGIDSESDYPYSSGGGNTGKCKTAKLKNVVAKFTSYVQVASNENAMAAWTQVNGPLSVCVDAETWQTYTGGIVKNCNGQELDHCVLVVGFNDAHSPPYWIVKNSWGTSWGEAGYILLEKGTHQCGIQEEPTSSVAAKSVLSK